MNFYSPHEMRLTLLVAFSMLVTALLIAVSAHAYVPSSQFVFNRVAALHGKGAYVIEDDVSFHEGLENFVVHENWIVVDGGEMRVLADGGGAHVFRLLKKGRVSFLDESGAERAELPSQDYYMKALLTRSATEEKRIFIDWGVLPADVLKDKKLPKDPKDIKDYKVETEPFVRLARVGGTVAYAYGKPAPVEGPATPELWIEQDGFVIRKMRPPDGAEMNFSDYVSYGRGLAFPKTHNLIFDNHVVSVRVTRVSAVELSMDQKRQMDSSWLRSHREARTVWPKTTAGAVVQEFYKRFR